MSSSTASASRVGAIRERSAELVVELPVSDLAMSVAFYGKAGFQVERHAETLAALRWGETYLFLTLRHDVSVGVPPVNIRVVVDDLDDRYAAAQRAGLAIRYQPMDRPYGLRDFTVIDPDGYELRFAMPI